MRLRMPSNGAFAAISLIGLMSSGAMPARATCTEMLKEMRSLAAEARGFERNPSFREYGLGAGGPYADWFERVKELALRHNKKGLAYFKDIANGDVAYPEDVMDLGFLRLSCAKLSTCNRDRIADLERSIERMRCR